jgi:hypothetical protein
MIDALLHEWKSDPLRIWIPLVAAVSMLIGLFGGVEIHGCRNTAAPAATRPMPTNLPAAPNPEAPASTQPNANRTQHGRRKESREAMRITSNRREMSR